MSDVIPIDVSQLIIGRALTHPIYDMQGTLLLAAGGCISADQKQRLVNRGLQRVLLHQADVSNVILGADALEDRDLARVEEQLNRRIDELVRSGRMNVTNAGPALKGKVVRHGQRVYDTRQQHEMAEQRQDQTAAIDRLVTNVLHGEVSARGLGDVTDQCIRSLTADLDGALSLTALKNYDPGVAEHSLNVAMLGMAIGIELGLDTENVKRIGISGLLQDIGMVRVPKEILHAQRKLTAVEFLEIQKHPIRTANYLERVRGIPALVQLVAYQAHESCDGTGYPRRRDGQSIHLFARILRIADAYTAMTAWRPFRPPLMPYAAMVCLLRQARQGKVDPDVVRALLHVLGLFPVGSYVTLSDGSVAQVLRSNCREYMRPIILRLQDAQARRIPPDDPEALVDLSRSDLSIVQALPTPDRQELAFSDSLLTLTAPTDGSGTDTAIGSALAGALVGSASEPASTFA